MYMPINCYQVVVGIVDPLSLIKLLVSDSDSDSAIQELPNEPPVVPSMPAIHSQATALVLITQSRLSMYCCT